MYNFGGEFRSRPRQSLGGAQKKESRDVYMQRVAEERQQREDERMRQASAVKIQAIYRGWIVRRALQQEKCDQFIRAAQSLIDSKRQPDLSQLDLLLSNFHHIQTDGRFDVLIWMCQSCLKLQREVLQSCRQEWSWLRRVEKLLISCCKSFSYLRASDSPALPLRVLEIFTEPTEFQGCMNRLISLYGVVVRHDYFLHLRRLLETRVPSSLQRSSQPPTEMARSLLALISRPLLLVVDSPPEIRTLVLSSFIDIFLCQRYIAQLTDFVIPAMCESSFAFPIDDFLVHIEERVKLACSVYLCHACVHLIVGHLVKAQLSDRLIQLLAVLIASLPPAEAPRSEYSDDDDDEEEAAESEPSRLRAECLQAFDRDFIVHRIATEGPRFPDALSKLVMTLIHRHRVSVLRSRLLGSLASAPFIRALWTSRKQGSWPEHQLSAFSSLLSFAIFPLYDDEMVDPGESSEREGHTVALSLSLPARGGIFRKSEMEDVVGALVEACMSLMYKAYPETRTTHRRDAPDLTAAEAAFSDAAGLLRHLRSRDLRVRFCQPKTWLQMVPSAAEHVAKALCELGAPLAECSASLLRVQRVVEQSEAILTNAVERTATACLELPMAVQFDFRVHVLHQLIRLEKETLHYTESGVLSRSTMAIDVHVRRDRLYEDAYSQLAAAEDLRRPVRVRMQNPAGLEEAGIDGGGIFREFLSQLLLTGLDANRGLFRTAADGTLYPNPASAMLYDDSRPHFRFLGQLLGKAIYERLLVEAPLSVFFLQKLLSRRGDIDTNNLASLDPELYRNLLTLKTENDVEALNLNFTVVSSESELGRTREEELIPGGRSIAVTNANRIEYIHRVADYKLNRQIKAQTDAFREGLASVVNLDWLRMFDGGELQMLVAGDRAPIDLDDLRKHTHYAGGYSDSHEVIVSYWRVLGEFSEYQKRALLKFVTSCSRPPLLGFRELHPPFCIQLVPDPDRLPTASTCMNLLKLPEVRDLNQLREKLIYAVESEAGFELS